MNGVILPIFGIFLTPGETKVSMASQYESWLRLLLVPELRKAHWCRLHRELGSPEAILGAGAADLCRIAGMGEDVAGAILRGPEPEAVDRELDLIEQCGVSICTCDDAAYPRRLADSSSPPPMFYFEGALSDADEYAVVVVGNRSMTQYGKLATVRITGDLVGAGVTVISGMAQGIDTVAHDTVLRHGGRTIAVLAQGLAKPDTAYRNELRRRIAEKGAVISEFPMTAVPEKYHFPVRNHTMASMALATVVVEARERSGSLITARKALEENRLVFAVPGDVTRENSRGTNGLIREGAALARDGKDVLSDLEPQLRALLKEKSVDGEPVEAVPDLSHLTPSARDVFGKIKGEPIHLDLLSEAVAEKGIDFGTLSAALLELEMKGLIRHLPGNLYITERTS